MLSQEKQRSAPADPIFLPNYFLAEGGTPAKRVQACGRDRGPNPIEWIAWEAFLKTCATLREPARRRRALRGSWRGRKVWSILQRMRACDIARMRAPLWRVLVHRSYTCGLSIQWWMKTRDCRWIRCSALGPEEPWLEMVREFPSVDRPLFSRRYVFRQK